MGDEHLEGPPGEKGSGLQDKKKRHRDLFSATVNDLRKSKAAVSITTVSGKEYSQLKIVSFDRESLIAMGAGGDLGRRFFFMRLGIAMISYSAVPAASEARE